VPARFRSHPVSRTTPAAVVAALALAAPATALAVPAPDDCPCAGAPKVSALTQPRPLTRPVDAGFHWDDAAIGAGGALVIVFSAFGAVTAVRARHEEDPPLPA
jgi:hypothetical protein